MEGSRHRRSVFRGAAEAFRRFGEAIRNKVMSEQGEGQSPRHTEVTFKSAVGIEDTGRGIIETAMKYGCEVDARNRKSVCGIATVRIGIYPDGDSKLMTVVVRPLRAGRRGSKVSAIPARIGRGRRGFTPEMMAFLAVIKNSSKKWKDKDQDSSVPLFNPSP